MAATLTNNLFCVEPSGSRTPMREDMETMKRTLLKLPQVRKRVPLSRATIYAMIAAGKFPRQIKLGGHASFWLEAEIDAWLQAQIDDQRGPAVAARLEDPIEYQPKAA